jgi:hypothetical protein
VNRAVTSPAPVDPAVYAQALADVVALRPYGTYRAKPQPKPPTADKRCGTRRGYQAHRARGEAACDACKAGNTAEQRAATEARL